MSNYTSENLISIPASSIQPGTLAIKIGTDYFQAAGAVIGTDVSDTTATAITVLGGYEFYDSAGIKTSGTIPTVTSATITPTTSNQIISSGVYLGGEQTILGDANLVGSNILSGVTIFGVPGTLVTSSGAEVTLGYISSGMFQPLTFSGTSAYNGGSAVNLSCYNWNLPVSSGSSGGSWTSSGVIIESGVTSSVISGENWENTTVNSGGLMYVYNGGTANSTTVNYIGSMYVYSGGTANSTTVNYIGWVYVSSGGLADSTTVNSNGFMEVYGGGTATNIVIEEGGFIRFPVVSNTYIQGTSSGSAFIMQDAYLSGYNFSIGQLLVYSGGTADSTTVNFGGRIYVFRGGTADSTTVNSGGSMSVSSGGTAADVIVSSGGTMTIYSGAVTSNITSETGAVIINS